MPEALGDAELRQIFHPTVMNLTRHMQVAVRRNFAAFGDIEIAVFEHSSNEKGNVAVAMALPLTFQTIDPYDYGIQHVPTMRLPDESAQQLMDGLWNAGLRPKEGSGSAGALAATQKHLEDFRALVFKREPPEIKP